MTPCFSHGLCHLNMSTWSKTWFSWEAAAFNVQLCPRTDTYNKCLSNGWIVCRYFGKWSFYGVVFKLLQNSFQGVKPFETQFHCRHVYGENQGVYPILSSLFDIWLCTMSVLFTWGGVFFFIMTEVSKIQWILTLPFAHFPCWHTQTQL